VEAELAGDKEGDSMDAIDQAQVGEAKSVSVIGPNIVINGNIEAAEGMAETDLQIEGTVNGDIRCGTVILTDTSRVAGNVIADRVRVSGAVEGGISTGDLAVETTARITGEIVYERLRIAAGGVVQGTMKWRGADGHETSRLKLVERTPGQNVNAVWID
jgi:cytoskeletal protein CcmA (bactofilin family)